MPLTANFVDATLQATVHAAHHNALASALNGTTASGIWPVVLVVSIKTANYTPVIGDLGSVIEMNSAGALVLTLNTGVFVAGDTYEVCQVGAGAVQFSPGSGFTIDSYSTDLHTAGQWASATVRYRSATEAVIAGALTT
jgi:3D (Asp-Asp-Asp) domain-containing protein